MAGGCCGRSAPSPSSAAMHTCVNTAMTKNQLELLDSTEIDVTHVGWGKHLCSFI